MVVTAIVGVLASLGVASFSTISARARMQRDADGVEELVRKARNLARGERRCVRIDASATRITMTPLNHAAGAPPTCAGGVDLTARKQGLDLPRGVRLAPTSFFFDRGGGAVDRTQEVFVTVTAPGLPVRTFSVRAFVGAGAVSRRG
jgi:type II secretory pathway pseudopilin PulG